MPIYHKYHGRAGRSTKKGRVIIQSNDTNNYILDAIVKHSYTDFYEKEIEYREKFNYPPFIDLVQFELSSKNYTLLKNESQKLYEMLLVNSDGIYKVYSPKSPFVQRINNKFRINILLKANINNSFYNLIYRKIKEYDKLKNSEVNLSISKNPMYI